MKDFAQYTSIAFRMLIIMLLGVFIGYKLDNYFELSIPIFKLILIPLSVVLAIIDIIRSLKKRK